MKIAAICDPARWRRILERVAAHYPFRGEIVTGYCAAGGCSKPDAVCFKCRFYMKNEVKHEEK